MTAPRRVQWPDWARNPLSAKQRLIYEDTSKRQLLNCGRGFGKDHISILRLLRLCWLLYEQRVKDPRWNRELVNAAIIAPVSSNYEPTWRKLTKQIPQIPGKAPGGFPNTRVLNKDRKVELFGAQGINISCFSAFRDDYIRGDGFDILLVTEAAFLAEDTYLTVLEPLVERPGYAGYIILNSTPANNWWDRACHSAQTGTGNYADFKLWTGTTFENPLVDDELRATLRGDEETNPLRYRRDRLAELFIDVPPDDQLKQEHHRPFPIDLVEAARVTSEIKLIGPYFIGIDLAYSGPDSLAVVVVDAGNMCVVHTELHAKTETADIVRVFERLNRDWMSPVFTYDANGRGATLEPHLKGRGLRYRPYKYNNDGKAKLVGRLSDHLHRGLKFPHPDKYQFSQSYQIQNMQRLQRELITYQAVPRVNGTRSYTWYGKPDGGSDDMADALMLAVWPLPTIDSSKSLPSRLELLGI